MLCDEKARKAALSPTGSFIVQAPAGSGKTELLTCRFLKLLNRVQAPDQIIALTFTRKAASEMRDRVLSMLERCRDHLAAGTVLEVAWWEDAKAVLARDQQYKWHLLSYPFRLKIMTFDALCQWAVRAVPGESLWVAEAEIERYPERFYRQAAEEGFQEALATPELQSAIMTLLQHLDNRVDHLQQLWVDLLGTRDQWLGVLYEAKGYTKEGVEAALSHLQRQALQRLIESVPVSCRERLRALCVSLARHVPRWEELSLLQHFEALTLSQATLLTQLLLTTQQTIRKRWDHHSGVKRELFEADTWNAFKEESSAVLGLLAEAPACVEALEAFGQIPATEYDSRQWEVLQALFILLPRLVAHLKVNFQQESRTDFIEIALTALEALGQDDQPTDLALYMDQTIEHLLVDEFQDTSWVQFELLKRLTAGWEFEPQRTVLMVGDPMQSIYRFRQAEVGLFLKVQAEGLGELALTPLYLQANFRSADRLVTWVNQRMGRVFPAQAEMGLGAVTFHASEGIKASDAFTFVCARESENGEEEARAVVGIIREEQARDPAQTIAVLVRSRSMLTQIIPVLQSQAMVFEGVDLFPIFGLPHIQDIWSLLRVLLLPTERLSWFALLRSPYVGLTLQDLHAFALYAKEGLISEHLETLAAATGISPDGLARLAFLRECLVDAWRVQSQMVLSTWLFRVHQRLHGSDWMTEEQCADIESFFQVLESMTERNTITEWSLFEKACQRLFARSKANPLLKIMTIHQAKGLEFDTVILPGLGRQTGRSNTPLLRWAHLVQERTAPLWLVSPLKAAEDAASPLYGYLSYMDAKKERFEQQRLLYVAVTRAKQRLYLLDITSKTPAGFRALLGDEKFEIASPQTSPTPSLRAAGEAIQEELGTYPWIALPAARNDGAAAIRHGGVCGMTGRLPLSHYQTPLLDNVSIGQEAYRLPLLSDAKAIGIIAHRWLQWICEQQATSTAALPWMRIEQELRHAGIVDVVQALDMIITQFSRLFESERGRWLIAPHTNARNEYSVSVRTPAGQLKTYIMDRIFEVDAQQWIIDFKTGQADEAAEAEHRAQLSHYAACLRELVRSEIRCGVYYLGAEKWVEW